MHTIGAEPHSSVGNVADLKTGGHWFDPKLCQYFFRELMIIIARGLIPLTAVHCFDDGYVGKQPVAWKEYYAEYWFKELQERIDRCTGHYDITNILLKTGLNTMQSVNQHTRGRRLGMDFWVLMFILLSLNYFEEYKMVRYPINLSFV